MTNAVHNPTDGLVTRLLRMRTDASAQIDANIKADPSHPSVLTVDQAETLCAWYNITMTALCVSLEANGMGVMGETTSESPNPDLDEAVKIASAYYRYGILTPELMHDLTNDPPIADMDIFAELDKIYHPNHTDKVI